MYKIHEGFTVYYVQNKKKKKGAHPESNPGQREPRSTGLTTPPQPQKVRASWPEGGPFLHVSAPGITARITARICVRITARICVPICVRILPQIRPQLGLYIRRTSNEAALIWHIFDITVKPHVRVIMGQRIFHCASSSRGSNTGPDGPVFDPRLLLSQWKKPGRPWGSLEEALGRPWETQKKKKRSAPGFEPGTFGL